ncbi:MAG: hypothetical protein FJ293_10365 [Planctomycetes bacterium]|nr:hypothetical protein [Planctomycetota bacterium]
MRIDHSEQGEPALVLAFARRELPIFRALLERASFQDIRPDLQGAVFDLLERLLAEVPTGAAPRSG